MVARDFRFDFEIGNYNIYMEGSFFLIVIHVRFQHHADGFWDKCCELLRKIEGDIGLGKAIPLTRIFKKEAKTQYVVRKNSRYKTTAMTLNLKKDKSLLREYIKIHRPEMIWPQIIENMNTIGVTDMEIYLNEYQAFLIMDTIPDFDIKVDVKRWANLPKEREWQVYVSQFQKVNSRSMSAEKWKLMTLIGNNGYRPTT
ncbi:L-rhamnose mutarotase [Flagellimonas sp. 2504JD4-2]